MQRVGSQWAREMNVGCPVFTSDGKQIGFVKEVRRTALKVDAPWQRDYWVALDDVRYASHDAVELIVESDDLDDVKRDEPRSDVQERYRARRYDETWEETPGPDYLSARRRWEQAPSRPEFSYGRWESNRDRQDYEGRRGDEYSGRERRGRGYGSDQGMDYNQEGTGYGERGRASYRSGRSEFGDAGFGSRYRQGGGIEGSIPRYSQDRGWGYQGQGGWNQRMGAPGSYSEPYGSTRTGSSERTYRGQPGRGYDQEMWGESAWYDTEAPRGYSGKGPRRYNRPDESICDEVCERLTQAGGVDATDVEVTVERGEVKLKGAVDDREQKRLAEDLAWAVPGVKDIHNEIRTTGSRERREEETTFLV